MKRVICIFLCLCLLLLQGGCSYFSYMENMLQELETLPAPTAPTQASANEIPYTFSLTQEDIDSFYSLLEESEKMALESADLDAVDEITDELGEQYEYLNDQCTIAQICYYTDLTDQQASQRYLDCVDILTQANDAYMQMVRRVYQSDAPAKEMLFEDWTQQELDMLMAYTDEVMALEKENSQLEVAYQSLEDPASDEMLPLYAQIVSNNNQIARIYGYENYYTYAYQVSYGRDYDAQQLEKMRQYVQTYLTGVYETAYWEFAQAQDALGMLDGMKLSEFMTEPYDDCAEAYVSRYLRSLPEDVGQVMTGAIDQGHAWFAQTENAYDGAFTTTIAEDAFCFFGPAYQNSLTVIHELGHYYGAQFGDLTAMPLDLAETQSQGNEWLFVAQLQQQMEPELYEALVKYKLYMDLCTILVCVIVDEFEQRIYTEPELDRFTPEDYNAVMEQVCQRYGGVEYINSWIADIQSYWRLVVLESPVYYISYGVSLIASMNLYTIYQQDPEASIAAYRFITEQWDGQMGFLQTMEAAGLPGPFEESFYENLSKMYPKLQNNV